MNIERALEFQGIWDRQFEVFSGSWSRSRMSFIGWPFTHSVSLSFAIVTESRDQLGFVLYEPQEHQPDRGRETASQ